MSNSPLVPKLRFPNFSEDYKESKFKDLYFFIATNSYSRDLLSYELGNVFNIHYGDIHTKYSTLFDLKSENVPYVKQDVDLSRIREEQYVQEGDLIIADASEDYKDIGKTIEVINCRDKPVIAGLHTFLARRKSKDNAIGYIANLLKTKNARLQIMRIAQGTKVLGISNKRLAELNLTLPKPNEQQKIVSFLTSIDLKLELLIQKHKKLVDYRKSILQKIFTQIVRFKAEDGEPFPSWKERTFKSFINARNEYPELNDNSPLGSLTIANGIEAKSARYVREFLVNDAKAAYKLVHQGDFVANPMNLRFGAIAKNHSNSKVKISKYYDVFQCDDTVDSNFFELYLLSDVLRKEYHRTATGTLEEKKRVHYSEFRNFKKLMPPLDEQKKISGFEASLKSKISLLKQQIEQTQSFKKGLLQQMFV